MAYRGIATWWVCTLLGVCTFPEISVTPSAVAAESPESGRPNVILIISDDQHWGDYSFMGHAQIQTPHLDQLAHESLTFTRGYVPSSLCRPSLATIITGLYPHEHGIVGNDPAPLPGRTAQESQNQPEYRQRRTELIQRIDRVATLPKWLQTAGYVSFQSGKWWEGHYSRGGFTHGMTEGFPAPGGRHGDKGLSIGRTGLQPIFDFMQHAQADGKPFFVWYAPFLPHAPHDPPERLLEKYRRQAPTEPIAKYWAMCEWFDETCGQLLNEVDRSGLRQNTIVVYVTDNGWINLAHKSAYAPRSKRSPNEGGIRTPIMVRYPGKVQPEMNTSTCVSSIDIAPTLLKLCGIVAPNNLPGIDLTDQASRNARGCLRGEIYEHDVADIQNPAASLRYQWQLRPPYKRIVPAERLVGETIQLFDVFADPEELVDLASKQGSDAIMNWIQECENAATALQEKKE